MAIRKLLPNERTDADWRFRTTKTVNQVVEIVEGLAIYSLGSFATVDRPTTTRIGASGFDETLGVPIWWNGTAYVNSVGVAV